jgi:hypothetical protein
VEWLVHRADEEDRYDATLSSRADSEMLPRQEEAVRQRVGRFEQKITRKSYGSRTIHVAEVASYHALGKLPEPDVAHRFF